MAHRLALASRVRPRMHPAPSPRPATSAPPLARSRVPLARDLAPPPARLRPTRAVPRARPLAVTPAAADAGRPMVSPASPPADARGYFRWPTLHGDTLAFVCEDDLYAVSASGGVPRRLTDAPGLVRRPRVSPDGASVAFAVAEDACEEIYACDVRGGRAAQITHAGAERARPAAWSPDATELLFVSSHAQPSADVQELWRVGVAAAARNTHNSRGTSKTKNIDDEKNAASSEPTRVRLGPASDASFQPGGPGRLLCRDADDPATANWKAYGGGMGGEAWIDARGDGRFRKIRLPARLASAGAFQWATRDAVVFLADDGGGRTDVYSIDLAAAEDDAPRDDGASKGDMYVSSGDGISAEGSNEGSVSALDVRVRRHTRGGVSGFCVRHLRVDAATPPDATVVRAAFCAGGVVYYATIDLAKPPEEEEFGEGHSPSSISYSAAEIARAAIDWRGCEAQLEKRRLEDPEAYCEDWSLHPEGKSLAVIARGRAFAMGLWDGPALPLAEDLHEEESDEDSDEEYFSDEEEANDASGASDEASDASEELRDASGAVALTLRRLCSGAPRATLARFLWDAERVAVVRDGSGEPDVEIHRAADPDSRSTPEHSKNALSASNSRRHSGTSSSRALRVPPALLGRPIAMECSPEAPLIAIANDRGALVLIDAETGHARLCDQSRERCGIRHLAWSPCGCWLAYARFGEGAAGFEPTAEEEREEVSTPPDPDAGTIRVLDARTGAARSATSPVLGDERPAWDPRGDYLYFLSSRELEPTYDAARFGMSFHGAHRPHALALRADVRNPLLREIRAPPGAGDDDTEEEEDSEDDSDSDSDASDSSSSSHPDAPVPIEIDFRGLADRVVALPMPNGRYGSLLGLDDGRFCVVKFPVRRPGRVGLDAPFYAEYSDDDDGSDDDDAAEADRGAGGPLGALVRFDLATLRATRLIDSGVRSATLSMDRSSVLVECVDEGGDVSLRAYKAGERPRDEDEEGEDVDDASFAPESGKIDVTEGRLGGVVIDPKREWAQMLAETWRWLRDEWFDQDMRGGGEDAEESAAGGGGSAAGGLGGSAAGGGGSTAVGSAAVGSTAVGSRAPSPRLRWDSALLKYASGNTSPFRRVASRSELEDVFREMAAELRSSHASVWAGDCASGERRFRKNLKPGYLGCDVAEWSNAACPGGGYVVTHVVRGDAWDDLTGGALRKPGARADVGDALVRINGKRLSKTYGPSEALVGLGGKEVLLEFVRRRGTATKKRSEEHEPDLLANRVAALRVADGERETRGERERPAGKRPGKKRGGESGGGNKKAAAAKKPAASTPEKPSFAYFSVRVRAMHSELDARYRDAIHARLARVHRRSRGRCGYLHLPDMERTGYGEFWRNFPRESRRDGLILDLRGNAGGHISELILAKLAHAPSAWDVPRRGAPRAYPSHAPAGALVVLVDERTGSDAELAAETIKSRNLGRVVGRRTWGGLLTVGSGRRLVDGGEVAAPTQKVVTTSGDEDHLLKSFRPAGGNGVENRGVVPDVEVDFGPSDHALGRDPQLDAAVDEATAMVEERRRLRRAMSGSRAEDGFAEGAEGADRARAAAEVAAARDAARASGGKTPWPFEAFAPYPGEEEEEEEEESEEDSEDSEDARRKNARRPKGARPRR